MCVCGVFSLDHTHILDICTNITNGEFTLFPPSLCSPRSTPSRSTVKDNTAISCIRILIGKVLAYLILLQLLLDLIALGALLLI